jgi:hypothetical protein
MDALHVVEEVVSPWETVAREATLTAGISAQMWPVAVPVHSVCFSFVPQKTSSRRELLLGTAVDLAAEGLQVGVNELAA